MKKLVLWFTLFCVAVSAAPVGPIAANRRRTILPVLIAHTSSATSLNSTTSAAIDTTGANLMVANVSWYNAVTPNGVLSDSKSNTWTQLTANTDATISVRLFYCYNGSVGSGHTFSYNGTTTAPSIYIVAFSGISASPFDVQNGNGTASGSSLSTGSITPSQSNELIITGSTGDATTWFIDSGFTISDQIANNSGVYVGGAIAYSVVSSTSALNPSWSFGGGSGFHIRAAIASFKF